LARRSGHKQWDDTEYRVSVPLGGYVKMWGGPMKVHDLKLISSPICRNPTLIAAGPVFNFLFAIAHRFHTCCRIPVEKSVQIGRVLEDSATAQAGLHTNDIVVALDGEPIQRIHELKQKSL
jgi:regulator of sigma E protease